jgi:hypothetical protein
MAKRMIWSHGGSSRFIDCFGSLLAIEALSPSKEIYLISPYISNAPILDNSRHFWSALFPFTETGEIYLADILTMYAWRGSKVRLICNPEHHQTRIFLQTTGKGFKYRKLKDNHEKGLITGSFYLHGSMNFTYHGIRINSERVEIKTDGADISAALLAARARWEEADDHPYRFD